MEKSSTGSVIEKEEIHNVYKEARLKVIGEDESKVNINEKSDLPKQENAKDNIKKEETIKESLNEDKEQVYETMTMSDFFDEFKI